ncbi:hypothetical protein AAMO2058_000800400 [Amorphochlora amoebiformis]
MAGRVARIAAQLRTFGGSRTFCSMAAATDDVLFDEKANGNMLITLNRPKALNALDASMVAKLTPKYKSWLADSAKRTLVMVGAGSKAFCAGGDIKAIYDAKKKGLSAKKCCTFFENEYELNQIIGTLPPNLTQVSILNGITMGGGVGLSVHGQYRIATNKTMFAMPETAIGFFCDVGGSYFLPRLQRNLGTYLALTGARLIGPQVAIAGVATHYVPEEKLNSLLEELLSSSPEEIEKILGSFSVPIQSLTSNLDPKDTLSETNLKAIERCFGEPTMERIMAKIEAEEEKEFAKICLKLLSKMSPTSLKVVLQQMIRGKDLDFKQCFDMEHKMALRFMKENDFFEGVRALLVDKDKSPKWNPANISEVDEKQVLRYF